jgi:zinc protease
MNLVSRGTAVLALALAFLGGSGRSQSTATLPKNVARATLENGLRVIIVRDPIAPVVTVEDNILAGGDETPNGFPGMAHAQEHMLFRGCTGLAGSQILTGSQISAIYAQLGGMDNADTQQTITQYFATVPSEDLDVVLHVDAACLAGAQDSEAEWAQERGAIEQEVARDLSNATYKFITRLNADMFAGTPYAHDALGTKPSFDATSGAMLQKFYRTWYAPNNAVLVITGDVDPQAVLAKVKTLYSPIPRHDVPPHPVVNLQPVKPETFTLPSDLPYQLVFVAFRMPGTDSPDFPAAQILSDVLASSRAKLYDLVVQGKALAVEFSLGESYRKASVGFAAAAIPAGANAQPVIANMRSVLTDASTNGLPMDLVLASKQKEVASAEFERNSISDLAARWSDAVAVEGRESPDQDLAALAKVTPADVNRVAKQFLVQQNAIVAVLKPAPSGQPSAAKGFGGSEQATVPPSSAVALPPWADVELKALAIPRALAQPSDVTLPNGIRLIVLTETISPTITVAGEVRHQTELETPPGKEGIDGVLDELFDYGTTSLDRIGFHKALDDIAATETGGHFFSLRVLKEHFSRGVQLLAADELTPRLPPDALEIVRKETADFAAGRLMSPAYRSQRALQKALLPPNDPELREATPQTISSVTLDDLKAYYRKVFRPDLTDIVVIGDITPDEARKAIEECFGKWKAEGPKPDITLSAVPLNKTASFNVADDTSVQDSVVLSEQLGINRFDPDYYPIELGNHVLGGGFYATRLYHDLRQVTGYVYTVGDTISAEKTRATYTVNYGCDPANVSKAAALVKRDLSQMQAEDVSPAELLQAKALLLRQIPLSESSEDAIANQLLDRATVGLPLDEERRAAARYLAMTAAEIRSAFARRIRPSDLVSVVQGPTPR